MFGRSITYLAVFLLSVSLSRCDSQSSIVSELISSEFTGFVNMLEHAGLIDEIQARAEEGDGVTLLPATDNFLVNKVSPVLLSWLIKDKNIPALRRVLMNHVVIGRHEHHQLNGQKTLLGNELKITTLNGQRLVDEVPLKKVNALNAHNGVAHSIEGLIVPDDIKSELTSFLNELSDVREHKTQAFNRIELKKLEASAPSSTPTPSPSSTPAPSPSGYDASKLISFLLNNGNFDTLVQLIQQLGLTDELAAQLENPTTILAPLDTAFSNANKTVIDHLNSTGTLSEVIKFHIITEYFTDADLSNGTSSDNTSNKVESTCSVKQYSTLSTNQKLDVLVCQNGSVYYGPQNALATASLINDGKLSASGIDEIMVPVIYLPPASSGFYNLAGVAPFLIAVVSALFILAM